MAVSKVAVAVLLLVAIDSRFAAAQTLVTELDVSVGHSTDDVHAAGTQLRIFGEAMAGWRFNVEGTWAGAWGPQSDAFGAAYPYNKKVRPMEVYAENTFHVGRYLTGVRFGRYRTPFGIYSRSDHAYNGFLRAPLIRYGTAFALSNNFLEGGASVIGGLPNLYVEASLGVPQDEDIHRRRPGLGGTIRVQGSAGPLIVGVSHIRTQPSAARSFARGNTEFSGVDVRWMHSGVQLRGEWIDGRPFNGTRTFGGYVDAIVHVRAMGPVTAVARAERLNYLAGQRSQFPRRYTAGARVRVASMLVGHVNVIGHSGVTGRAAKASLDLGLTFTVRR
jgi:hypothetical protein